MQVPTPEKAGPAPSGGLERHDAWHVEEVTSEALRMEAMPKVLPFQKQHDIFVAAPPLELPRFLPFQSKRQEGEWSGARVRPAVWAAGVVTAVPGNLPGIFGDLPLPSRSRQEPTLSLALLRQLIDSVAGSGQDGDFFQLSWDPVYRAGSCRHRLHPLHLHHLDSRCRW